MNVDEDPRLAHRPKAIRVKDVVTALPATLDDLLDDQPASYTTAQLSRNSASADHQRGRKRGAEAAHGIAKRGQDTRDPEQADDDEDNEAFEVVVSKDGKITVQARDTETVTGHKQGDKMSNGKGSALRGKVRTRPTDDDEEDTSRNLHKADAVGGKRQRVRAPGEEYRSKKSGGDIWRRGMLQPHAYIPLDPRLLSKKNHKEAVEKFGAVVNAPKGSGGKKQVAHNKRKQVVVGNRNQRRNMRDK
jgi:ribosomal RNA-processing protein 12